MPGAGTPTQAYTNIISNLVSNGYIVLGVNSLFINGAIQLANDHVVAPQAYSDVDGRRENIGDLKFVLNNIQTIKFKYGLENSIDILDFKGKLLKKVRNSEECFYNYVKWSEDDKNLLDSNSITSWYEEFQEIYLEDSDKNTGHSD